MSTSYRTEKAASNECPNCKRQLVEPDNFCRWCGFHLSAGSGSETNIDAWHDQETTVLRRDEDTNRSVSAVAASEPSERAAVVAQKTTVLENDGRVSQPLAGVVIDTLKLGLAVTTGSLRLNRFGVLAVAVLISIPMWLLIILLSPLQAFIAAKAASSQMSIQ